MSEEIDLEAATNLCATEDAFDQFQAVSMYQEDEFITLSDIVPPQPVAPDLTTDLSEIPYDNEVVLSSNFDDQLYEVNSMSEPGVSENTCADLPSVNLSDNNSATPQETTSLTDESLAAKPRRGRKKKTLTENNESGNLRNDQGIVTQENNVQEIATRSRRGRKSNNTLLDQNAPNNNISIELPPEAPKRTRKRISNTPVTTSNVVKPVKKTSGRRGRAPKVSLDESAPNVEVQQSNGGNQLSDFIHYENDEIEDSRKSKLPERSHNKRGKPKKKSSEQSTIDSDQHNISNVTSSEHISSSKDEIIDTSLSEVKKKGSGRRGRKRKLPNPKLNAEDDPNCSIVSSTDFNDIDNICLSTLSKKDPGKHHGPNQLPPEELTGGKTDEHTIGEINPNEDDEVDDMFLSNLKQTLDTNMLDNIGSDIVVDNSDVDDLGTIDVVGTDDNKLDVSSSIINYQNAQMPDSEYIIDDDVKSEPVVKEENNIEQDSLLVEDPTKRPVRRKAKQALHYDEGSDEDPYANMELSDDEPSTKRRGRRYNSDDEYIPGSKRGKISSSDVSDSDIDDVLENFSKQKRKKVHSTPNKSPRKRNARKESKCSLDVTTIPPPVDSEFVDDIEVCLQSSVIKAKEDSLQKLGWGTTNEFESFLAQKIQGTDLKIKKVSNKEPSQSPLKIPVLDPEAKKTVEMCAQTNIIHKATTGVQTSTPYEVPMKENVTLTSQQSEKACEFLKSIVQTTSELGQLMTQKSEDFITKKINTDHVTDTFKMDYCVRKSFLLLKLAKHNLVQMEEDLSKQYEDFLRVNGLLKYRAEPKKISPSEKTADNDSDCEIVEETVEVKKQSQNKPKFNPKTVFLNKELSIKIAKKPTAAAEEKTAKEKLNVKGRHTVWISDSVMVKKVKPTQSFLAQDSRNKKPPDCTYVTEEMVSDFFKDYYHQQTLSICAPFTSTEWLGMGRNYICNYFFIKPEKMSDTDTTFPRNGEVHLDTSEDNAAAEVNDTKSMTKKREIYPETLFSLCMKVLQKQLSQAGPNIIKENSYHVSDTIADVKKNLNPETLFRLCIKTLPCNKNNIVSAVMPDESDDEVYIENTTLLDVPPLKTLCYRTIKKMFPVAIQAMQEENTSLSPIVTINHKCTETYSDTCKNIIECDTFQNVEYNVAGYENVNETKSLLSLCMEIIQNHQFFFETRSFTVEDITTTRMYIPNSLKQIALEKIQTVLCQRLSSDCVENINSAAVAEIFTVDKVIPNSLKDIAFENIQNLLYQRLPSNCEENIESTELVDIVTVQKVKRLAEICFEMISVFYHSGDEVDSTSAISAEELTINCINTLSEEAFYNIRAESANTQDNSHYLEDEQTNFYDEDNFNDNFNDFEENIRPEENSWVAQVQMKELKSCFIANRSHNNGEVIQDEDNIALDEQPISRVKIEPEEVSENIDSSMVKTEPVHSLDEMTIIPDNVITKRENVEYLNSADPLQRHNSSGYNVDAFESFVCTNKIMHAIEEFPHTSDEIFSQSALRVRRQYQPDSDDENDYHDSSMSLLIPQTFEPLNIDNAKGDLMASSSDENSSNKKPTGKKKTEKRSRGRPKKTDPKPNSKTVPVTKEKPPPPIATPVSTDEVAVLTRRMRDKIRQEEKKIESSDSDNETLPLSLRKKENGDKTKSLKKDNAKIDEIQCNNVDSTEQIENDTSESKTNKVTEQFTGFTAVDQNEISCYEKYVKYVYNKILPKVTNGIDNTQNVEQGTSNPSDNIFSSNANEYDERPCSPLMNPDEPVELLECEPTMPIFDDNIIDTKRVKSKTKVAKNRSKIKETETSVPEIHKPTFTDRNGWQCYAVDSNDPKLYQKAGIFLEKLPESFVETYFTYQNITHVRKEDEEVDRLINLQSLNRSSNLKDVKNKTKLKEKITNDEQQLEHALEQDSEVTRPASPANSDRYDELTPSEDEGGNVEDNVPPPAPKHVENNLAKNSLMNDDDSDIDAKIKKEPVDHTVEPKDTATKQSRRKQKDEAKKQSPESLMLTADKMMNKELNLLHAPIILKNEIPETPVKGPATRSKHKGGPKNRSPKYRTQGDDDSSSEEEKQWVSTKEKLLKRMGRKQDTTREDDAKRAKLVSEFIERRADMPETRKRGGRGPRRRRSSKKMLEREKQLRVLSNELFGQPLGDATGVGKKFSQSLFKGRRNIRKVIDKKSLARSTLLSNMEEFERKRRLNQRQNRLRELLGCEEGVNVLVINDEVCLEYDFEEQHPVVTIHAFFTKVMKAHQYEGVKFMWDACFESLEKIESGHPGGGCILAHCMGLGKTLQVLALLHTVLTHPRVGMRRVLVCCPLSTVLNWVDEIHKWIGPVTDQLKVFELSKLKKTYERAYQLEDWYSGGGIFIIGYELFRSLTTLDPELDDIRPTIVNKIRTALLDPGPDIIVCDEGHLLKNDSSVLAVAMSRVATKRRIVLTGTPMQNNLREYYCMVNFIKPNLLGTYMEYSNRFENPIMNGQHRDSIEADIKLMKQRTHILHKVLEGCLQRQEASVLYPYLPKKHEYTVFISLTKCQWDLYKHYLQHYGKQTKQSLLKDFHILQKIWSHPQVLHNFQMRTRDESGNKIKPEKLEDDLAQEDLTAREDMKPSDTEIWWLQYLNGGSMLDSLDSSNKFVAVFRILDECIALGDKVLIFSTSLITMDALEFFLRKINKWSLGQEYYRLDGSVPPEVRQKWCREFNAENNLNTKLFLISTRAGSLGLNMVAANRVIILDTSWNPAHDIQSIFRVYRFGQKKDCYIYRLVAMGTMEQKIYERSVTKQAVACRVVDEQQIDRHYNMAELTELYGYDEHGTSVAGGVAVGVTDVALLRVARDAALHAVHEHDSLLRGSSEHALPEHERAAAWMQFQQEHAHKQMQNHLIPSFSLLLPVKKQPTDHAYAGPSIASLPPIKTEETKDTDYTPGPDIKPKRGHGRKKTVVPNCRIKIQQDQPKPSQEEQSRDEDMVRKIMDLLIRHKFAEQLQGPNAVANLVANVRKIVAYGKVPKGSFNNNSELTESIAKVLLGKEEPPPSDVKSKPGPKSKRGRPRTIGADPQPSTSKQPLVDTNAPVKQKRTAAAVAEMQIDSIAQDSVIDLDGDHDWNAGISDRDLAPEEIVPEPTKPERKRQATKKRKIKEEKQPQKEIEKQLNTDVNSILLSDDEEPLQPTTAVETSNNEEEVVPLHPSLLNNKNFIKIVAHTYLEGNPLLDEDAATLAAQYSTSRALNEIETTGKKIVSGPIYDIAARVLGMDILVKLHQNNPKVKEGETSKPCKVEPPEPPIKTEDRPRFKAKGLSELMSKPTELMSNPTKLTSKPSKLMSKQSKLMSQPSELISKPLEVSRVSAGPVPASAPVTPTVVPVGLFKRAINITPNEPLTTREESILPDDDDVHIISDPAPITLPKPASTRSKSKPLILNSVLATSENTSSLKPQKQTKNPPLVLKISAGKLIKPLPASTISPPADTRPAVQASVPTPLVTEQTATRSPQNDTICLDSDEEESITPNIEPIRTTDKRPKRVALKSTAKPQVVPVSLTAANPQLDATLPQQLPPTSIQPFLTHTQHGPVVSLGNVSQMHPNYLVIPSSQFGKLTQLPQGMKPPPLVQRLPLPQSFSSDQPITRLSYLDSTSQATSMPQNMNYLSHMNMMPQMNTLPQNMNLMNQGSQNMNLINQLPQNMNLMNQLPQNINMMNASPQNMNYMNQIPQNMTYMNQIPQNVSLINAAPQNINMVNAMPQNMGPADADAESILPTKTSVSNSSKKTVCKPGDILRITKTGQVEILNRAEDGASVVEDDAVNPNKKSNKPSVAPEPVQTVDIDDDVPSPKTVKQKSSYKRVRKISSSSSSSSDSSRAPSPSPEDPLSILKDVVHIRAAYEDLTNESSRPRTNKPTQAESLRNVKDDYIRTRSKDFTVGNTSITKSVTAQSKTKPTSTPVSSREGSRNSTPNKTYTASKSNLKTVTPERQKIIQQINKTNNILKKLDDVLVKPSSKKASQSNKTISCKVTTRKTNEDTSSPSIVLDSVDLTELDSSPLSSLNKLNKNTVVGKQDLKGKVTAQLSQTRKDSPLKVVGTSKNIIISSTGKASTSSSVEQSGNKAIRVTNVEKIAPATTWVDLKKRTAPSTETNAPKKKKTEQMTLKDFNIDDFDDIIELE